MIFFLLVAGAGLCLAVLVKCPECANMVSDKAVACPKCGIPAELIKKALERQAVTQRTNEHRTVAVRVTTETAEGVGAAFTSEGKHYVGFDLALLERAESLTLHSVRSNVFVPYYTIELADDVPVVRVGTDSTNLLYSPMSAEPHKGVTGNVICVTESGVTTTNSAKIQPDKPFVLTEPSMERAAFMQEDAGAVTAVASVAKGKLIPVSSETKWVAVQPIALRQQVRALAHAEQRIKELDSADDGAPLARELNSMSWSTGYFRGRAGRLLADLNESLASKNR